MTYPAQSTGHDGLGDLIGLELLEPEGEVVRARVPVTDAIRQPAGIVHGGAYAVLAESLCSEMTGRAVREQGMAAFGAANSATFLRPIASGHLNATARPRHRGRTTWVWDCEIADDEGRVCALVRMTAAIRPLP